MFRLGFGHGAGAVKKQRKPRSKGYERKRRSSSLPLDTSREHRNQKSARRTPSHHRGGSPGFHTRRAPGRSTALTEIWGRLANTTRAGRTDAAMLALPVVLIALTIAVGRWTHAEHITPQFATLTPGARHALVGLPSTATPIKLLSPKQFTIGESASDPILAGPPSFDKVFVDLPPTAIAAAELTAQFQPSVDSAPDLLPAADPIVIPADHSASLDATAALTAPSFEHVPAATADPVEQPNASPLPIATAMLFPDRSVPSRDLVGGLDALNIGLNQCRFERTPPRTPAPVSWTPGEPESFGLALAVAARRQLDEFVIYNDRYTRLKYPMGDVHPMYGVCTDVIIRAYRVLGLDLQELLQKTKIGSGDPNIDHRRVDTLRKFFSRFGESLPISTYAEDYKPGDIVSYWRPQNRHSRTHIAIVSDMTGPSGRPLIIHNRGWGPQQEDGLFVDEITGHYRFSGLKDIIQTEAKTVPRLKTGTLRPDTAPSNMSSGLLTRIVPRL